MCELCNLERKTTWHYWNDIFIICDCETCKIPMIITKEHVNYPEGINESYVHGLVKGVFKRKFRFRKEQRKVFDHWHWHIIFEEE